MGEQIEIQNQNPQNSLPIPHHHITPWVALVIIAAIAGTVGYLVWAKAHESWPFDHDGPWNEVKKSSSLLQREGRGEFSELAGWKTYRNEEGGFEVRYPGDWELEIKNNNQNRVTFSKFGQTQKPSAVSFDDGVILSFWVNNSYDESVKLAVSNPGHYPDGVNFEQYGFNGTAKFSKPENYDYEELISAYRLALEGKAVVFDWQRVGSHLNDFSYNKFLLPILSTFKFIEP